MERQQLTKTLETLHAELAKAEAVDDDTRALLAKLTDDIERLSSDAAADEIEPVNEQVHDLVLKFETDHPQITRALNQLASALANLGI